MALIGLAIYHGGSRDQTRLAIQWLLPASSRLQRSGPIDRLWFDRFDARGPHLYCFFGAATEDRERIAGELKASLEEYLERFPSRERCAPEELAKIHRSCQGKTLCEADRRPGLAENDSFLFFDHPEIDYPLWMTAPGARSGELWQGLTALSSWSLGRLAQTEADAAPHAAAIAWVHAVDRELRQDPEWAAGAWRYAAASLVYFLNESRFSEPATCLEVFPSWIGARNLETFGRIFDRLDREGPLFPELPQLVQLARSEVDRGRFSEFALVREFVHAGLSQLAIPVALRSSLLVYCWLRRLRELRPELVSAGEADRPAGERGERDYQPGRQFQDGQRG